MDLSNLLNSLKAMHPKWRSFSLGICLAIILTTGSYAGATHPHNVFDEFDTTTIDWSLDSSLSLSQEVAEYSNLLLSIHISVTTMSEKGEYFHTEAFNPIFPNNSHGFRVTYKSSTTELNYLLNPEPGIFRGEVFLGQGLKYMYVDQSDLVPLHQGFSEDIKDLSSPVDITGEDIMMLIRQADIGTQIWEIHHIYNDGTMMDITVVGDLFILRIVHLDTYVYVEEAGGTNWYADISPYNQLVNYPTYMANISGSEVMPNYTNSASKFIGAYF